MAGSAKGVFFLSKAVFFEGKTIFRFPGKFHEVSWKVKKDLHQLSFLQIFFSYAAGRTRTGTVIHRLILSQVRLPIPPQRHCS